MKTGNWVIFKNENWNVYNLLKMVILYYILNQIKE